MTKCSLTGEKCGCPYGGFWDDGDGCPIGTYKSSSRKGKVNPPNGHIVRILDVTCRFYGIARAKRLEGSDFYDK